MDNWKEGFFRDTWSDYESRVIPDAAGPVQRASMKQSFLAGALAYQCGMSAAFKNDADDGLAIQNLKALDAEVSAMSLEYMDEVERMHVEQITGQVEPADAPMKTNVHFIEARGLSPDDVTELNGLIKTFIDERVAERKAH